MPKTLADTARKEYRVVHKIPGVIMPIECVDKAHAERIIASASGFLKSPDMKIQSRTVTEWEDE